MTVVVIVEYQVQRTDQEAFVREYKHSLLPTVRNAPGFRHVQLLRGKNDTLLLHMAWNLEEGAHCSKHTATFLRSMQYPYE